MLMQMHAASKQEARSGSQAGPGGKGGSKGIRHTSQDIAGPPVPADEGTSTLRLVLALGCFVARQRQRQLRSKQRAKRRRASLTAAGRAAAADTVGGSSSGDDDEEEEQGGSEAGWFDGQDVVQDSAEDVEQLHGEPEVCTSLVGPEARHLPVQWLRIPHHMVQACRQAHCTQAAGC